MRDKKRIKRIMKKVTKFWKRYPNMRLNQLMTFLQPLDVKDPFYLEDDMLEKELNKVLKHNKSGTRGK